MHFKSKLISQVMQYFGITFTEYVYLSLSPFESSLSEVQRCCRNWCPHCVVSLLRSFFQSNCHYFTFRYFEDLPFKFVTKISFHS